MSVPNHLLDRQTNRRRSERMEIEQEVNYRIINRKDAEVVAQGKTVNISSSGVLFTTQKAVPPGRQVELDIHWPAQLDNKCGLKLVARGRIVRQDGEHAALEILQHEFRTKGTRR